jgi:hypothetical protein
MSAGTCLKCNASLDENRSKSYLTRNVKICKQCENAKKKIEKRIERIKIKLEMIQAYGGKCVICSEQHPFFLVLDHVENNGSYEKERGTDFYKKLKKLGFPKEGLQLLCHNCNARKEYFSLRKEKNIYRKKSAIVYKKAEYALAKEDDCFLWQKAREIYSKLEKIKY